MVAPANRHSHIKEEAIHVLVGVDCHKDTLAVCIVDNVGAPLAEDEFSNDLEGHRTLLAWAREHGKPRRFGLEGAGG